VAALARPEWLVLVEVKVSAGVGRIGPRLVCVNPETLISCGLAGCKANTRRLQGVATGKVSTITTPHYFGGIQVQIVHQSKPVVPRDRLIRLPELEALIGCKKSTVYTMLKQGTFPRPIRLSARMVAWPETAVLQWIQDRIKASEQP
jgi:prophage regulatory protein